MILKGRLGITPFLPCGLNSLAMCTLTLYPRGDPSDKVLTRSDSACYGHVDSNRLPQSYMVLRSLYGLRPEILVWVERTSTRLICRPFQNINLTISIYYNPQPTQNKGHRGSSHPRLFFRPLCSLWRRLNRL